MTRIAITGVGPVSALGIGRELFGAGIRSGHSAITANAGTAGDAIPAPRMSAAVRDFSVDPFLKSRKAYLDRASELALAATALALSDAGLDGPHEVGDIGLMLGTAYGNMATMVTYYEGVLEKGPQAAKPVLFPHLYPNTAASLAAIEFDLGGAHAVMTAGWVSGAAAIMQAADWIAAGRSRTLLAGGVDAMHPLITQGLQTDRKLSPLAGEQGGDEGIYSFDQRANGIVIGEGAAMLALEAESTALDRGAAILGELAGSAMGEAGSAEAAAGVMRQALDRAGCSLNDLGWVCAHGAGDPALDQREGGGLAILAGERSCSLPVWTPAPLMGETLAAGTGLRVALILECMLDDRLPPLPGGLNCQPDCVGLEFPASSIPKNAPVMINTFDPGGSMVALVVNSGPLRHPSEACGK